MKLINIILFFHFTTHCISSSVPVLTQCNVLRINDKLEVSYELEDSDNSILEVKCSLFYNSGNNKNNTVPIAAITGDIGTNVTIGPNKKILISLANLQDLNSDIRITLSAFDNENIDISDIIKKVNTNRMLSDLIFLQGRRNESTDKTFKEKSRLYITENIGSVVSPIQFESKVGQLTNINFEANFWGNESPQSINIVDAHYDSFAQSPGVDDNASGVAGVLEIFRILSEYSLKKTVRFLFFDLEENGLIGSNLYINNQLHSKDQVENVINFEMIGYYSDKENTQELPTGFNILFPDAYNEVINNNRKGNFITNVGNTTSKSLITIFQESAKNFVPELKVISLEVPGNGSIVQDLRRSDHANFWDKGYKALMITDGANFRNKNYHTIRDSAQYLNMDFMTQVVKTSLAAICQIAEVQHGACRSISYLGSTAIQEPSKSNVTVGNSGDNIFIESKGLNQISTVDIFNIHGHKEFSSDFNGSLILNNRVLNLNGLCFIQIRIGSTQQTYKIFVSQSR